jgi:hypothetical protein
MKKNNSYQSQRVYGVFKNEGDYNLSYLIEEKFHTCFTFKLKKAPGLKLVNLFI